MSQFIFKTTPTVIGVMIGAAIFGFALTGCATNQQTSVNSAAVVHPLRLSPNQDVREVLTAFAKEKHLKAASIVSGVGSLKKAELRYADQSQATKLDGPFEIVSLSGLISEAGVHLHAAISNSKGKTIGGHLTSGNVVNTTLEIVILEYPGYDFLRRLDPSTGFNELVIVEPKSVDDKH